MLLRVHEMSSMDKNPNNTTNKKCIQMEIYKTVFWRGISVRRNDILSSYLNTGTLVSLYVYIGVQTFVSELCQAHGN